MAKKMYIGVDGKARRVKRAYVGVSNVARKIKKMYMGVDGIARCIFSSGGELSYYGKATSLKNNPRNLAATSVGAYALFGGGYTVGSSTILDTITAYNESLTRSTSSSLSLACESLAATSLGDYALFGGGIYGYGDEYDHASWRVNAYDSGLTRTIPEALDGGRSKLAATSVGNYALFGGGIYNPNSEYVETVDAYDTSLTKNTNVPQLAYARGDFAAVTIGGYALFPNGKDNNTYNTSTGLLPPQSIETYDASLTRGYMECPISRWNFAATSVGNYALIGGGYTMTLQSNGTFTAATDAVHAIDKSLTLSVTTSLSSDRLGLAAASVNGYALFGGGVSSAGQNQNRVDAYDDSLTRTIPKTLSTARGFLAATSVGNYVLFGGGNISSGGIVDVYQVTDP